MSKTNQSQADSPESPVPFKPLSIRDRVLAAAWDLFREHGFSSTSMLDIVTRARVSKRDLYALFKNKHALLAACIGERTQQMRLPLDPAVPMPGTRRALAALLVELGVSILKTVCLPEVLTVFRLAIAESKAPLGSLAHSTTAAGELTKGAHGIDRKSSSPRVSRLRGSGTDCGRPLFAVLLADLQIRLLLRVRQAPTKREIDARARTATETLTALR